MPAALVKTPTGSITKITSPLNGPALHIQES